MDIEIKDIIEDCVNIDTLLVMGYKCGPATRHPDMMYLITDRINDSGRSPDVDLQLVIYNDKIMMLDWCEWYKSNKGTLWETIELADPEMHIKLNKWIWDKING